MSQVYLGEVRDGVVVFEGSPPELPDGTRVRVEAIDEQAAVEDLSRRLSALAGIAEGLPHDLAAQHDHYLHGQPKR